MVVWTLAISPDVKGGGASTSHSTMDQKGVYACIQSNIIDLNFGFESVEIEAETIVARTSVIGQLKSRENCVSDRPRARASDGDGRQTYSAQQQRLQT